MNACKVLLVSGNEEVSPYPVYPLALPRLAAALDARGHVSVQHDVLSEPAEELDRKLRDGKPDLVGISIRNIDNTDSGRARSYVDGYSRLVARVRGLSAAPVVLGGGGFSLFPTELLSRLDADYGVVGPGEDALCELADCVASGATPAGIGGLLTRGAERPSPPAADARQPGGALHDPDMLRYYWQRGGMIGVQTKRGCPRKCVYCTYPFLERRHVRHFDVGEVIEELVRLKADFDVSYVFFVDAVFNAGSRGELELAAALEERSLGISWGAFFSPQGVDEPYLAALKRAGLTHVEFGTDSLCDPVLESYGKGFCFDEVLQASGAANSLGLHAAHYLVFGGPGETKGTVAEALEKTETLGRAVFFPCFGMRIYPGTPLHEIASSEGLPAGGDGRLAPVFYFAPGLDPSWIRETVRAHAEGWRNWLLPSAYELCLPAMQKLRQRGKRGPLWEYLALAGESAGARSR